MALAAIATHDNTTLAATFRGQEVQPKYYDAAVRRAAAFTAPTLEALRAIAPTLKSSTVAIFGTGRVGTTTAQALIASGATGLRVMMLSRSAGDPTSKGYQRIAAVRAWALEQSGVMAFEVGGYDAESRHADGTIMAGLRSSAGGFTVHIVTAIADARPVMRSGHPTAEEVVPNLTTPKMGIAGALVKNPIARGTTDDDLFNRGRMGVLHGRLTEAAHGAGLLNPRSRVIASGWWGPTLGPAIPPEMDVYGWTLGEAKVFQRDMISGRARTGRVPGFHVEMNLPALPALSGVAMLPGGLIYVAFTYAELMRQGRFVHPDDAIALGAARAFALDRPDYPNRFYVRSDEAEVTVNLTVQAQLRNFFPEAMAALNATESAVVPPREAMALMRRHSPGMTDEVLEKVFNG